MYTAPARTTRSMDLVLVMSRGLPHPATRVEFSRFDDVASVLNKDVKDLWELNELGMR